VRVLGGDKAYTSGTIITKQKINWKYLSKKWTKVMKEQANGQKKEENNKGLFSSPLAFIE